RPTVAPLSTRFSDRSSWLYRIDRRDLRDQSLRPRLGEEPLDRGAALAAERQRELVDVHQDEPPARLLVDPPPIAHRILERLVLVRLGPGDRVAQPLRELPVHIVAQVAPHDVDAERERQAGLARPHLAEVE